MHLLPMIAEHGGLLIVDSTRSGKRMPDALSKTVPIWCAVINQAYLVRHGGLLEDAERKAWREQGELFCPPWIGGSELDEIHQRLDLWAKRLLESSFVFDNLSRPLRPIWVTPASHTPTLTNPAYYPVVCVCASRMVEHGLERRMATFFTYVQGAGDDHEMWCRDLTPSMFWEHRDLLLSSDRESLPTTIEQITQNGSSDQETATSHPTPIAATQHVIALGTLGDQVPKACAMVYIHSCEENDENDLSTGSERVLRLRIRQDKKKGKEFVQEILPAVDTFCARQYMAHQSEPRLTVLHSSAAVDVAIGVTIMVLARYFGAEGELLDNGGTMTFSKELIRRRLEWIQKSIPSANPSRTIMKRVNEYLMSPRQTI